MNMLGSRIRRIGAAMLLGTAGGTAAVAATALVGSVPSAFADSQPYELYCPGTPVGTIVLNDAVTTGTISPASPAAGSSFNLTNFQTKVALPAQIVQATQALGNTAVSGSAQATINATGATPASISSGNISFSAPIPNPVPSGGLTLDLPATASTVGPFKASGGAITLSLNSTASLSVSVTPGSPPLALSCKTYANDAIPQSGIASSTPPGAPVSPQIASASAGGGSPTASTPATTAPPTAASTATTAATSTPASTAFTGPGQDLWLMALIGLLLVAAGFTSYLVGPGGRGPLRLRFVGASRADLSSSGALLRRRLRAMRYARAARSAADLWVDPRPAPPPPDAGSGPSGLWSDGWEPGAPPTD